MTFTRLDHFYLVDLVKGKEPYPPGEGAKARAEGEHWDPDPKLLIRSEIPGSFHAFLWN